MDILEIKKLITERGNVAPRYHNDADIVVAMELLAEGHAAAFKNPAHTLAVKVAHQKAGEAIRRAADDRRARLCFALGIIDTFTRSA